jgi:hypothetical protein
MKGVETERLYCRIKGIEAEHTIITKGVLPIMVAAAAGKLEYETIPCYSFLDMLGKLEHHSCPDVIIHDIDTKTIGIYGKAVRRFGDIGHGAYIYNSISALPEALAKLILWLGEQGYIDKGVE